MPRSFTFFLWNQLDARLFLVIFLSSVLHFEGVGQRKNLDDKMHHIRNTDPREWLDFPEHAEASRYVLKFNTPITAGSSTLCIRQHDIKQDWSVELNNVKIGMLAVDEKDMRIYYAVPQGLLTREGNTLVIQCASPTPDDVFVGEITFYPKTIDLVLGESQITFEIIAEDGEPIPGRITLVDEHGVLQTIVTEKNDSLAVRPGYVYSNGRGTVRTVSGEYTLYATRGFEYGVDSLRVTLEPGKTRHCKFILKREVDTRGWVSSDTHLHTYTHSGHGDCTDIERAVTIAGEGIEVPIMTEHNKHVDLDAMAMKSGTRSHYTPVTGNEVTTRVGHFNIFPVSAGSKPVDHEAKDWRELSQRIHAPVIILNHGRDVHHTFRPFDAKRYLQSAGWRLDENEFFANAMEVINSGSQQSDPMQLFHDWFGLLNRGHAVTPVGSSDSHDVSRFFAGQARTFVQCDDQDVANINLDSFLKNFIDGRVMVSLGLLVQLSVNDLGPGDLVPAADSLRVVAEVHGPGWSNAEKIALYANGKKIRESKIISGKIAGLKEKITWTLPRVAYDQNFVAIAEGSTGKNAYWPLAKPYQPASASWTPKFMGATGAIWIDGDGNGKRNSAYDYGAALLERSKHDVVTLIKQLDQFDAAVASQVAAMLWKRGINLNSEELASALKTARAEVRDAFQNARDALKN